MDQAAPLHLSGWAVACDASYDHEADDADSVGFAYHGQTGRLRGEDDGFFFVHRMRLDHSAEHHLRVPDDSALVEITRTASLDVTGCIGNVMGRVGGNAHCDYDTATAT
eukprot:5167456-Pyramimonas_sp.AAC.1